MNGKTLTITPCLPIMRTLTARRASAASGEINVEILQADALKGKEFSRGVPGE